MSKKHRTVLIPQFLVHFDILYTKLQNTMFPSSKLNIYSATNKCKVYLLIYIYVLQSMK